MRAALRNVSSQHGSILLLVGVGLPVLLLVFAIVVDVGNFYVHKRALQNQVDAAVLAGSQLWGSCFKSTTTNPPWLPMQQEAENYDGQTGFANDFNPQFKGLHGTLGVAFNSTVYPLQQPSGLAPDDTPSSPCTLTTLSDGQQHYVFDIKATERNTPFLIGGNLFGLGPSLHATARTDLRQVKSLSGILPIGVTDPSPQWMWAQFVDEDNADAALTGWIPLCKIGRPGCAGTPGTGNETWTTETTTPVTIPATTRNVGVRLKYVWAGTNSNPACGTVLANCYDNVPSQTQSPGLEHIRAYAPGATGVRLRNVWMLPGTCSDGYFAAATCSAGVQGEVSLGAHPLTSAWSSGACAGGCAQVWATVDGAGTNQLSPPGTFPPLNGLATWTLLTGLSLGTTGPHQIGLAWQWKQTSGTWNGKTCTSGGANPCVDNGSFEGGAPVQRSFVADNAVRSGPVQGITIWSGAVTSGANSFPQGSTQNLGVTVSNPCFETEVSDPACPMVDLRVSASATGSESQSLDCDPNQPNIKDEIANGCAPAYTIYPAVSGNSPCPTQSALWSNPNPPNLWDCVAVQTGNGDVEGGLQQRIGTNPATCANNWPNYPANDKRQVPLFLVPYSAFNQSGSNQTYPVIGFAAFYVTGYKGDPCPNATTQGVKQGTIPGYFITYIASDPNSVASNKPCDPLGLLPCIPVLVK